jgi:hypothetical protein
LNLKFYLVFSKTALNFLVKWVIESSWKISNFFWVCWKFFFHLHGSKKRERVKEREITIFLFTENYENEKKKAKKKLWKAFVRQKLCLG